ncbi:MAG: ankyrin repeat domain-containing protein, partial [Planctomycetaceae bacterium]|nr:ankyrin repeat domain-containing protein [Planctomycetaceae bacterium]
EGATPLATAAGPWNEEIQGIVQFLTSALQIKIDQDRMKAGRPKVADFLRSKGGKLAANLPANGDGLEIWQATSAGDLELLKKVLAEGTNINVRADDGATPLINATVASQLEAVALLVEKGADVNARTNDQNSSLHAAAFIGNLKIVQLLVASNANLNVRNQEGETPLDS